MKIGSRIVLLAIVIMTGVWLWTILFPSPEKIIRKRLAAVAASASFDSKQNPLMAAIKAETLTSFCSTNVEVDLDGPGRMQQTFTGREEITRAILATHSAVHGLKVEFLDVNVTLAPDRQSATADLTIKAQVAGEGDFVAQELKFTLQKIAGDWLITRVETVRTLS